MSVRVDERGENLLEVYIKATALLAYSIRAVGNEDHFKLRYRRMNGEPIVELSRKLMYCVSDADGIIPFDKKSRRERFDLQSSALRISDKIKAEITMNVLQFGLNKKKAMYWNQLIVEWREVCLSWIRADNKKYGKVEE